MIRRNRICPSCGDSQLTFSKAEICQKCYSANKKPHKIEEERSKLFSIYGNVEGPTIDKFNKRCYTFTHSCGTTQTWRFGNLLKQFKNNPEPCSACGGKRRMTIAMDAYKEKYGLDERARTDFQSYRRKVRGLSEKTYLENIDLINPNRHKRSLGNQDWHLDHKVSIIDGFRQGLAPEELAIKENLQMLPARDNMTKGRRSA